MNNVPIFRSAITGEDGQVDAGYLALFWVLVLVVGAIPVMCVGTLAAMYFDAHHVFKAQELGVGIGAVCTGFAAAIGGVGLFRAGDKTHPQQPSSTTTISTPGQEVKQVVTTGAPADEIAARRPKGRRAL